MDEPIYEEMRGDLRIRLHADFDPSSPRDGENLGTLILWCRECGPADETLGHYETADERVREILAEPGTVALPVYCSGHSSQGYGYGAGGPDDFPCRGTYVCDGRDPGRYGEAWGEHLAHDVDGVIYATREQILANWQRSRLTADLRKQAAEALDREVRAFNAWATGEIVGWTIEDDEGEHLDGGWGYYPNLDTKLWADEEVRYAEALTDARGVADHFLRPEVARERLTARAEAMRAGADRLIERAEALRAEACALSLSLAA